MVFSDVLQLYGEIVAPINTSIKPFKTRAFHNGKLISFSDVDLRGKWSKTEAGCLISHQ